MMWNVFISRKCSMKMLLSELYWFWRFSQVLYSRSYASLLARQVHILIFLDLPGMNSKGDNECLPNRIDLKQYQTGAVGERLKDSKSFIIWGLITQCIDLFNKDRGLSMISEMEMLDYSPNYLVKAVSWGVTRLCGDSPSRKKILL